MIENAGFVPAFLFYGNFESSGFKVGIIYISQVILSGQLLIDENFKISSNSTCIFDGIMV